MDNVEHIDEHNDKAQHKSIDDVHKNDGNNNNNTLDKKDNNNNNQKNDSL